MVITVLFFAFGRCLLLSYENILINLIEMENYMSGSHKSDVSFSFCMSVHGRNNSVHVRAGIVADIITAHR